jgi:hypothetical protein
MAQGDFPKRTIGETVNTWMQIAGILIAAVWGVYTFVFKEITNPRSAPVNISMNLQLKKVGAGSSTKANLTAVELNVSATNPSTREIHLLPSAWIAHGVRISATEKSEDDVAKETGAALRQETGHSQEEETTEALRAKAIRDALQKLTTNTVLKHAAKQKGSIVAAGLLFTDEGLKPNEKIERTIIFYVPTGEYDLVDVYATMPSEEDVSHTILQWSLNQEDNALEPLFYSVNKNGETSPIQDTDLYSNRRTRLQWSNASSEISIWPRQLIDNNSSPNTGP